MRNPIKAFKVVAVSAIAVGAFMSTGVSAASAESATFSSTGPAKLSGTLAVSWGGNSTNCTFNGAPAASTKTFLNTDESGTKAGCANGNQLSITFPMMASKSGGSFSLTNFAGGVGRNPFYAEYTPFYGAAFTVPFVNGAGAVPSKITFNKTVVNSGVPLTFTGTLTVSTATGSLLTLK